MKATDLRIGNYVKDKYENNIYQIANGIKINNAHLCEPIELTEEWLFKMGFEKEVEIEELIYKKGEFKMSLDFIMYDIDIKVQFKTVHHLQNTFYAITGEELTIK